MKTLVIGSGVFPLFKNTKVKQILIQSIRRLTADYLFQKTLPQKFGSGKIYVTSRSDIRLLFPGLEKVAADLFWVADNYLSAGNVVWDIGSNLGIFAFCAAAKVGRSGRVFSLEADPRYADIQHRSLKNISGQAGEMSILCAAAADQLGLLELVIPKKGHARNHLNVVAGNSAGEAESKKQVVTLTLDYLLDYWSAPQFVKIDVEGAEVLVARGGSKLFSEVRPAGYIECAPENADALTTFFRDRDYRFFSLGPRGEEVSIDRLVFNTILKPGESLVG